MNDNITLPTDTNELRQQISTLRKLGHHVRRCTEYQIKIGPVNYFWSKGTITIDPHLRHSAKGFDALLELLRKMADAKEQTVYRFTPIGK